jgi:hypothetical protein
VVLIGGVDSDTLMTLRLALIVFSGTA